MAKRLPALGEEVPQDEFGGISVSPPREVEDDFGGIPEAPAPAPAGRPLRALPAIGAELAAPAPRPPAEDVDDRLRTLFQLGLQINPSEAAGVNYLARSLDLPPALVAQQYPLFRKAAEAAQFDPARFRRENPGLVELLLENPRSGLHPAQAEQVSGFTRALKAYWRLSDMGNAFVAALGGPDPEGIRAGALRRAVSGEMPPAVPAPSPEELFPAPRQVPTAQSPLKGRTGVDTTAAILAAEGRRGLLGVELGDVGFAMMVAEQVGEDPEVLRRRAIEIQQELGVQVDYGQSRGEQLLIDAAQAVTSQYAPLREGGKGYALGAGLMGAAALAGTRSPAMAARAAHTVGMLFGRVGFSYGSFKQEAGSTYVQLLDEKLDDGTPLDRDTARGLAFLYGVAASAVETASFGVLAKSLGPFKEMIAKGEGRAALRAWLADRSKREILKAVGKQWAASAASEGIEEGVQTTLQHAITWAGKSLEAGAPQEFDAEGYVHELGESIYLGAVGGVAMATPGTVVQGAARLRHLEASRRNGHVVAELAKLAGTEAALGAPQAVAELVTREARRAGAGEVSAVYLDAEAAEQFFQTQGTDAATGLSDLLGVDMRPAVAAALAGENLGRIEIPLERYL